MCSEVLGWVWGAEMDIPVAHRPCAMLQAFAKQEKGLNCLPTAREGSSEAPDASQASD